MMLVPIPNPATRNMMPAAVSEFSWHWTVELLEAFLSSVPTKIPAPGIPLDTVLELLPVDILSVSSEGEGGRGLSRDAVGVCIYLGQMRWERHRLNPPPSQ